MLKRLELVGFKSFADKTQFDFVRGLTAIVGPNGSGKSNVVDAVRWILGEQSAKSLRGGEMADVIFNGSTSRRSLGMAEASLIFDNTHRILATDSAEVQITRRVYRDGQGEYLINQQICRLRDIKELFLGSGAGGDAYCIIEQGKVDSLLQASSKDRREIFEEAAGISRFKAKKLETLRKLERVDQNLQRLRDIADEVEKQLRSVKLQAAKAQRWQEYNARLKELRVALGLRQYHQLTGQLENEETVLSQLRAGLGERAAQVESWESDLRRREEEVNRLDEAVRQEEARLAQARQQIATEETTLTHEETASADLEKDLARIRSRLTELNARVAELAETAARAAAELAAIETQCQDHRQRAQGLEDDLAAEDARLRQLSDQVKVDKAEHFEQMRQAARLTNDAVDARAHLNNLTRERERLRLRSTQAAENLASIDLELQQLLQADEALQARLTDSKQTQADQRQERERLRQQSDATAQRVADLREQRSGLASRVEVLEGLERSHEGLGTGVREMYALLEQADPGPWRTVLGLVADFLRVPREYAPLIDLALGERAQRFLVRDMVQLAEALAGRGQPFSGRTSFLPLSVLPHLSPAEPGATEPPALPGGVVAGAEQVVACDHPELAGLPRWLLGQTLIVRDRAAAYLLAAQIPGYRFVTLQGEVFEADGTLTVGAHHAETGILSRKSELRELRQQAAELDRLIGEAERELAGLRERVAGLDRQAESLQEEIDVLAEQAADLRSRIDRHRQKREGLHEEVVVNTQEITGIDQEIQQLEERWQGAKAQAEAAEQQVQALQARMDQADQEIRDREQHRHQRQQECTAAKVALAQVEERLAALTAKHRQIEDDRQQRLQERTQGERQLDTARHRLRESQRTMLQASAALAHWYLEKEAAERQAAELTRQRDTQRQEKQQLAERLQGVRNDLQAERDRAHARELVVNDLRHSRNSLADRIREDYQLELAELYQQAVARSQESGVSGQESAVRGQESGAESQQAGTAESQIEGSLTPDSCLLTPEVDPATVNDEIAELRRKISRLGNVNLEALQELAELEARSADLQNQLTDLTSAKAALQEIIAKINQDSRRLFSETFDAVRTHFQELFRKLFGGGMADIVLEDETDVLESGVEIIARPPGKELRSISLMSGGERTLTVVALLLAMFRSKPSPFCILDEVDAALDEANIGRFTAVVREFTDQSQFILITHSKKTMAAADVLYGVTMQESGVSKRVAVRFEDWPDDSRTPPDTERNGQENGEVPGPAVRDSESASP